MTHKSSFDRPHSPESLLKKFRSGNVHSEGFFTVNSRSAIKKLGLHQLPFKNAWALKMIQAATAAADYWDDPHIPDSIVVEQTQDETLFNFVLPWDLDTVEEEFLAPHDPDPALAHLVTGLWNVAFGQNRTFALVGQEETAVWNGTEFQRIPTPVNAKLGVRISHWEAGSKPALTRRKREASKLNREVARILRQRACLCPVTLWINDELVTPETIPAVRGSITEGLHYGWSFDRSPTLGLSQSTKNFLDPNALLPTAVSSAWFLYTRVGSERYSFASQNGNSWHGHPRKLPSFIAWVSDGVIIRSSPIDLPKHSSSVLVFTSAQGLKTDISGFYLVEDEEYKARYEDACRGVARGLKSAGKIETETIFEENTRTSSTVGGVVAALLGGTVFATLTGGGLGFFTVGVYCFMSFQNHNALYQGKRSSKLFQKDFEKLREDWLERYGSNRADNTRTTTRHPRCGL